MTTMELRMDNGGVSPGEVGGVFAGVIALLALLGKGAAWLINWKGARDDSRSARLSAWEASLDHREREQREKVESRLNAMEKKLTAVTAVTFEMCAELHRLDPASPALAKARVVLKAAFPIEPTIPDEISDLVDRLGGEGQ